MRIDSRMVCFLILEQPATCDLTTLRSVFCDKYSITLVSLQWDKLPTCQHHPRAMNNMFELSNKLFTRFHDLTCGGAETALGCVVEPFQWAQFVTMAELSVEISHEYMT